jgi:hypothetical protein
LNIPLYINERQLKTELNKLFNNKIVSVDITLDGADNPFGIAFAEFGDLSEKENCLNLHKEQKFIFIR